MKKLLLGVMVLAMTGFFWSCDDVPENPGDFDLKSELTLGDYFWSISDPTRTYPLTEATRRDTTYKYSYTINDTVFEYSNNGKDSTYVYGSDGKPLVNVTDTFYFSSKTAVLVEMNPVVFESYVDTLSAKIYTNARWTAKQPSVSSGSPWLYNYNTTESGGGDSEFSLRTARNRSSNRKGPVYQYVFTSDSMICVKIPVYQKGSNE